MEISRFKRALSIEISDLKAVVLRLFRVLRHAKGLNRSRNCLNARECGFKIEAHTQKGGKG